MPSLIDKNKKNSYYALKRNEKIIKEKRKGLKKTYESKIFNKVFDDNLNKTLEEDNDKWYEYEWFERRNHDYYQPWDDGIASYYDSYYLDSDY